MAAPNRGHVLVVGDVMVDIVVRPEGPVVPGSDRRAQIVRRPGGSAANQAAWLGYFGVPVTFVARVGATDLAHYWAHFSRYNVTPALAGDPQHHTGSLIALVDPDGQRSFLTDRGANLALSADDIPSNLMRSADMLLVSGYSLFEEGPKQVAIDLFADARDLDISIAVDPASTSFLEEMGPEAFLAAVGEVDILSPNQEEATLLTGSDDTEAQIAGLLNHCRTLLLKCGAKGAILADRTGRRIRHPAPHIRAIDSSGAGDAFLARYIAETRKGSTPDDCLIAAIGTGAAAAARVGAQPAQVEGPRTVEA